MEKSGLGRKRRQSISVCQTATIRDWIRKGKDIPRRKIGKAWKFKLSELEEWIASGKSAIE